MAVPKRKTSKRRRDLRRASSHRIEAPALQKCPRCGAMRRPHHVCANCGTYKGRQVLALDDPEV
jgi:large subunit ribosomal protein L32